MLSARDSSVTVLLQGAADGPPNSKTIRSWHGCVQGAQRDKVAGFEGDLKVAGHGSPRPD
jgi:hypothetical protein